MNSDLLTKGMRDALCAIYAREGSFHKIIARKIERAGLAVALPSALRCSGLPTTYASLWALTEEGLRVVTQGCAR